MAKIIVISALRFRNTASSLRLNENGVLHIAEPADHYHHENYEFMRLWGGCAFSQISK